MHRKQIHEPTENSLDFSSKPITETFKLKQTNHIQVHPQSHTPYYTCEWEALLTSEAVFPNTDWSGHEY